MPRGLPDSPGQRCVLLSAYITIEDALWDFDPFQSPPPRIWVGDGRDWIKRGQDNVDTSISRRRHERTGGPHRTSRGGGALIEIGIDEGACSAASTRGAERSRLAGTAGTRRCVERCCASTRQTRRSDSFNPDRTWSMQARRRAGLRSFPLQPPRESFCPRLDRRRRGVAGRSPPRAPSSASPDPSSVHRTPDATYSK